MRVWANDQPGSRDISVLGGKREKERNLERDESNSVLECHSKGRSNCSLDRPGVFERWELTNAEGCDRAESRHDDATHGIVREPG